MLRRANKEDKIAALNSTDKFFLVTDPNQTLSVFNSIGQSLAKLRVLK